MIEKSLLLTDSTFANPPPDPDAALKALPSSNSLPKASTERWNQANLEYFDLNLNRAHEKDKIVFVKKDVYYKNVILFI